MAAEPEANPLSRYLSELAKSLKAYEERGADAETLRHYKGEYRALILALGELRANNVLDFFDVPQDQWSAEYLLDATHYQRFLHDASGPLRDENLQNKRPASLRAA